MNTQQVEKILTTYRETLVNIKQALDLADVPPALIEKYTTHFPDLNKMIPEDVIELFKQVQVVVILYLHQNGFSLREIARRVHCGHNKVNGIIKKYTKEESVVNTDEVSQKPLQIKKQHEST